jgi:hypothetical protein
MASELDELLATHGDRATTEAESQLEEVALWAMSPVALSALRGLPLSSCSVYVEEFRAAALAVLLAD